ncbi:hypothetical protein AB0387_26030 [Streptomyces sp. NPDC089173]|uniref:hypothetical protein n=1 Tax=Streptomyces sp. NPDC089173 TaxID=3154965 RepID=UPI00344E41FE
MTPAQVAVLAAVRAHVVEQQPIDPTDPTGLFKQLLVAEDLLTELDRVFPPAPDGAQ